MKYLVYGGHGYSVPTLSDAQPGEVFDDADSALAEFDRRSADTSGYYPLWDNEMSGGVLVVSDDDSETLDVLR